MGSCVARAAGPILILLIVLAVDRYWTINIVDGLSAFSPRLGGALRCIANVDVATRT